MSPLNGKKQRINHYSFCFPLLILSSILKWYKKKTIRFICRKQIAYFGSLTSENNFVRNVLVGGGKNNRNYLYFKNKVELATFCSKTLGVIVNSCYRRWWIFTNITYLCFSVIFHRPHFMTLQQWECTQNNVIKKEMFRNRVWSLNEKHGQQKEIVLRGTEFHATW